METKENQMALCSKPIFLMGFILTLFIFMGCSSSQQSRIQRIEQNAITPVSTEYPDEVFDKKLPEMSGDEYERLGDTLLSRGKLHIAYLQYERALEADPSNLRAEYKKGLALLLGEKSDEPIVQFKIVLEKERGYAMSY